MCWKGFYRGTTSTLGQDASKWIRTLDEPLILKGNYQMTAKSQVVDTPLLILHFVLDSILTKGNPCAFMADTMSGYLTDNTFMYEEIRFDLTTNEQMDQHDHRMANLIRVVEK
jgi:hypothetical protein